MQKNRISKKQQVNASLLSFPKSHIILLGTATIMLGLILSIVPSQDAIAIRHRVDLHVPLSAAAQEKLKLNSPTITDEEPLPLLEHQNQISPGIKSHVVDSAVNLDWHYEKIQPGDNLAKIFSRVGLDAAVLYELMHSHKNASILKNVHPNQTIEFGLDSAGSLIEFRYNPSRTEAFKAIAKDEPEKGFSIEITEKPIDKHLAFAEAQIDQSLFLAAQSVGLPDNTTMELANIFGWDVDFALDIRSGDHFTVLYEEHFLEGEKIGYGNILAARFSNKGRNLTAIRYEDDKGNADYYTPEGLSMRKEFLRTPIDFARVSSRFNLSRMHPILHKLRAHKGVDYAASRGTPIKASGDGKIIHAGKKGGYGNTVVIQHGQRYSTLYAHMRKFGRGIRSGKRVKQGQIIGYVGSSGLATGPHLHYEFRVNGVHKNPLTVKLPHAKPLATKYQSDFKRNADEILAQLELRSEVGRLAKLDFR